MVIVNPHNVGVFYFLKFSLESDLVCPEVEFVWRYYMMVPNKNMSSYSVDHPFTND